jgi:hypothetical protein
MLGVELAPGYQLFELVPAPDAAPGDTGDPVPVPPGEVSQVLLRLGPAAEVVLPFL